MDNSESITGSSVKNRQGLQEGDGELHQSEKIVQAGAMEGASVKNRARTAKKHNGKEESGILSEEQKKQYSEKTFKELESHFVLPNDKLKDPKKCLDAPFYCELCELKLANIPKCLSHIKTKGHKRAMKTKGKIVSLTKVAPPSEHQTLALSNLLDSVFLEHGLCPVKDLPTRQKVAEDVGKAVCTMFSECSVSLYGSSLTGFGLKDSDVNLDLAIPDEVNVPHVLLSILDLLQNDEHYHDVKSEFDAKVPRILFKHLSSGLVCELSPGNITASKTSWLLKKYCDFDPRVRTLVVALRYWARICNTDCQSEGGLPGYSLALMVIQFLQETRPPVLPRWEPVEAIEKDSPDALKDFVSINKEASGSLWFQLFRFYCVDFDIPNAVISIKDPMPVSREKKKWGHRRIAIEDPFSSKRNVASSLSSDAAYDYFFTCWMNSFLYFSSMPNVAQNGPVAEVKNVKSNVTHKEKDNKTGKNKKQEDKRVNNEEAIFEIDDLGPTTKQIESLDLSSNDCEDGTVSRGQTQDPPNLKNEDHIDPESEVKASLTTSDGEDASEFKATETAGSESISSKGANSDAAASQQNVEYSFDVQVFTGNNRPVKTCCFCKEDGHVKELCPDLRKPALIRLPPMTVQFGAVLDFVCKKCRADFEFEKSEVSYREKVLKNLEDYIRQIFPEARLFLFGSSKNGFGFRNSDIDICMTFENQVKEEVDCVDVIIEPSKLLKKHKDCGNVLAITTAKVPIVKFYLRSCKREADISLYNTLALENTKMLATYAKLDDRVATLGYAVKVFAKVCDIGDASKGSLSSYAYILMLLHYLQQCKPPVIPVLQSLYTDSKPPEKIVDGWNCWFLSEPKKIQSIWNPKEKNPLNAGLLWYGFLKYYTEEFDFEHDVVCCRRTKKLTKFEKMWTKHVFAIEDPFNLDHNLGAGVTRKMAHYILTTFIRGRERFGFPRYDILLEHSQRFFFDVYYLTDGYEAPTDRNCRVCGKIGHIAKDCPHSKANRRAEQKKEEEERRLGKEPGGMTQKPFSARPRSASAPNKQGEDRNIDRESPRSTPQPRKIPPQPEPNASNVNHVSRSQPDSQVSSSVKKSPGSKPEDGAENGHERAQTEIPQRELPIQNLPEVVTTENVVPGSHETMLDTNNTQRQSTQANSSSVAKNEIGEVNTIASCGDVVMEPSGVRPLVPLPSFVDSGIRTAVATVGTATVQASHAGGVKPPPGFYTPDGTPQVSRMSSEGPPPLIAGSIPQSPPVNVSGAGMFQGHPIVLGTPPQHPPGMVSPQSGQVVGSPIQHVLGTPPQHQLGIVSPQSGPIVGSPVQREMWLRQQGGVIMSPHSPPMRPLVPYPLSPDLRFARPPQHWRGVSESLPGDPQGSPLRGHQRLAEHNHQMIPQSPPNISRSVMWPLTPNSPHHNLASYPDPVIRREQHFPLQGHHSPFPGNSSSSVVQQQTLGTPPGPPVGSPQQMSQLPQQGGIFPAPIGTHMTGEQFFNLMRAVEEESKKEKVLPTKLSSNKESESKELHITPKSLKVAKTPEEHKLLSKLSKVKSLWEGNDTHGLQSNCPNPETIEELDPSGDVKLEGKGSVGHSDPDGKLPDKREAWVSEKDDTEVHVVQLTQDELDESAGEAPNNTTSLTEDNRVVSSETVSKEKRSSSSVPLASDEKLEDQYGKCDQEHSQKNEQRPPSDAKALMTSEEIPRQKPTRRGGRGRKPKGPSSKQSENASRTPEKQEGSSAGNAAQGKNTPTRSHHQKGYDDFNGDVPSADRTPGKQEKSSASNTTQGKSTPTRGHHQKGCHDIKGDVPSADRTPEKQEKSSAGNAALGKNTPTRGHHQKGCDDIKGDVPSADRTPEKQEKSSAGNTTKGKNTPTRSHHRKGYDDSKDGVPNADRTPEKQEKTSAGNATKGKNTPTRSHHQKGYDDFKGDVPNADRTPEKQEKSSAGNATKGKNTPTRSHHQKGYDDFKGDVPNADRTPEKQEKSSAGNATKGKDTPTRTRPPKGYDDFKGDIPNADISPEKQEKSSAGNTTKRKNTPTRSRPPKGNDDFRGDAPKASPKNPRVERPEGSQGAHGGAESTPRQFTRNVETSEKSGGEKGATDANKQDHVKNTRTGNPANSPGDCSKGGTPSRGRRRPRSRTSKGVQGDEKQDSRNRSNSTPEKPPPKNP